MTLHSLFALLEAATLACLIQGVPALAGPASSFTQATSRGTVVARKSCTDRLGNGEVVLVEEREREYACGGDAPCRDKYIHAYRFADDEQIWQINDLVEECDYSLVLDFIAQALHITDLDGNGLNEIWVVYKIDCINDIGPQGMKLIMYEGRKKHAIRGDDGDGRSGGAFNMDTAFREGPESFRRYARTLWMECAKRN